MNWNDEEYVRLYTRDTTTWRLLPWQSTTVLLHMLKGRFDRSGVFVTGRHDVSRAVTAATGLPQEVVDAGLPPLLAEGVWVEGDGCLVWPEYVPAQTAVRSDAARKRDERARNAAQAAKKQPASRMVTSRDSSGHGVTARDNKSRSVTRAEQSRAEIDPPTPLVGERHAGTLVDGEPADIAAAGPLDQSTTDASTGARSASGNQSTLSGSGGSENAPARQPVALGASRAKRDPMAYLDGGSPQQRPDVQQVFREFTGAVGQPNRRLRGPGFEDQDANYIAEALDTYGLDDCLLVAKHAPQDGMVNGTADDKRNKHDSPKYVFGNPDTFSRILHAAKNVGVRESRHRGKTMAQIHAEAIARGDDA